MVGDDFVFFFAVVGGMEDLVGEIAVVGEKEEAFAVAVEAADGSGGSADEAAACCCFAGKTRQTPLLTSTSYM